jgi:queuine tRNA-ribosyltransferase
MIVGNTYHLMLRPGSAIIEKGGGLHQFMNWPKSILTDSGGVQAFSLAALNKVTEEGFLFQSHIDGSQYFLGPKESMQIQRELGSDIVMSLDENVSYPCQRKQAELALERTLHWAQICRGCSLQLHQNLFAIIQGSTFADLRQKAAEKLGKLPFEGFGIGGLAVGIPSEVVNDMVEATEIFLPWNKPRYLMGFGTPRNIIEAVMRGVDMFDCVMPTRDGRHGTVFTWSGRVHIRSGRYAKDFTPLDSRVNCYTSQFSKAYLRHLMNVNEILGHTLISLHNLAFYLDFMRCLRQAILESTLMDFYQKICKVY